MIPVKRETIFFTGATASIKEKFPGSSIFAMGKFAIEGLAQSLCKPSPLGIHVAHFVIDGAVDKGVQPHDSEKLTSGGITEHMSVLKQPKQAWTHEVELRTLWRNFEKLARISRKMLPALDPAGLLI